MSTQPYKTLGEAINGLTQVRDILTNGKEFDDFVRFDSPAIAWVLDILQKVDHFVIQWLAVQPASVPRLGMQVLHSGRVRLEGALGSNGKDPTIHVPIDLVDALTRWVMTVTRRLQVHSPAAAAEAAQLYLEARLKELERLLWQSVFDLAPKSIFGVAAGYDNVRALPGDENLWVQRSASLNLVPLSDLNLDLRQAILSHLAKEAGMVQRVDD